jgi:peptide/nickel transport system substrate-binding protein/oligopeptide transport system substrate-binding protein
MIVDVMGGSIAAKLYNGLVRLDDDLGIRPDIARNWEIQDNGRTYIFYLHKNIKFHNNREVTAKDFKYSFKRLLDPESGSPNTWVLEKILGAEEFLKGESDEIKGIEVLDRYTLQIRLSQPFSPFLNLLTMTAAYVVPREVVQFWGADFSSHPVGTGPFRLEIWKHNNHIELQKNNEYILDKPRVEGITYRVIPEDLTAVTEFELGNLDVITIPSYEYARYRDSEKWKKQVSSARGLNTYYLGFNCAKPPFNDLGMRKAVAYAIDRTKILDTFYEKRGRPARGPIPDILRNWDPPAEIKYENPKALKIIKEKGMTGKTVNFYITSDQEVIDIAEIIQSYLMRSGLNVQITQLEWSAYKEALNNGEADIFWLSWWADYADPENFLYPLFHSSNFGASGNRTWYSNKEVDRLIEAGQKTDILSERNKAYMKAEKIISAETPWVFFWHKTDFTLRQPYIKNYKIFPVYSMDKGVDISF